MITSTLSASACSLSSLQVPEETVLTPLDLLNPLQCVEGLYNGVDGNECGLLINVHCPRPFRNHSPLCCLATYSLTTHQSPIM